jgi:Cu(I)/Ag(I) efflux system membrane fusion protein
MKRPVAVTAGLAILLAVAFTGYFTGRSSRQPLPATESSGTAAPQRVYTCSMHPQVRLAQPGNCPICEMPLIPAGGAPSAGDDVPALTLSEQALAMASVETTPVAYREMSRALRAVGKVAYHEPSLATITARVDGYAERLFVNVTGVDVQAGDHLVEIYSPDLLVAQQELLIALRGGTNSPLVASARIKLRNLGLTTGQIEELATSQTPAERVTLQTPSAGTVIEKTIVENSAFKAGDVLYRIANLEQVWVYLEIYEFDLAWVRDGQAVEITTEAYPGRLFTGTVAFVEPVLNERTRTVRVPAA